MVSQQSPGPFCCLEHTTRCGPEHPTGVGGCCPWEWGPWGTNTGLLGNLEPCFQLVQLVWWEPCSPHRPYTPLVGRQAPSHSPGLLPPLPPAGFQGGAPQPQGHTSREPSR